MKEIRRGEWVLVYPKTDYGRNTLVIDVGDFEVDLLEKNMGSRVTLSGTTSAIMEDPTTIKTFETSTWRGKEKIDGIWRKQSR